MKRPPAAIAEIVAIGNSKGVRIPKAIREQAGLEGRVTLSVENDALVIRAARRPRDRWAKAFARAVASGPDEGQALLADRCGF
ncbi:MAG: AbrB/MazE/SpoVT family DNA-binding domain-containing protein, partial [Parvularculaceae bacterium]